MSQREALRKVIENEATRRRALPESDPQHGAFEQKDFAALAGIHPSYLSRILLGRQGMSASVAKRIADAAAQLGGSIDALQLQLDAEAQKSAA